MAASMALRISTGLSVILSGAPDLQVVGDGDLHFAEHGLDLPQVGGGFLRVERFQLKLGARGFFGAFRGHSAAFCTKWSSGQVLRKTFLG
jgi:hypothetical protein